MTRRLTVLALTAVLALGDTRAAFAVVADEKVERAGAALVVTWTDTSPVSIYASEHADAALADAKPIARGNRKGRIETPAGPQRLYFLLKDDKDGSEARAAERLVPLEHGSNFRDIGGYPAADGKHVRWGLIYRSGGTPLLTDADVAEVRSLGLKDMIDLRSSEERSFAPTRLDGVRYTAVGYSMASLLSQVANPNATVGPGDSYRGFPTLLAPQLRILFHTLLAGEGPVAYNCSAGQDRTGFTTAVLLLTLGVPHDVVIADYHLSTALRRPEYEVPKLDAASQPDNKTLAFFAALQKDPRMSKPQPLVDANHRALVEYALDEIQQRWGSVDGYLAKEIGVDSAQIAELRRHYLE